MLAPMSGKAKSSHQAKSTQSLGDNIRGEFPLLVGLGTVAIFWGTGSRLVEIIAHPVTLIVVFLWLFAVILWSLPANRWIAPSRAVLQPARRQFLSQRHHDAGGARFGSTGLYYHNGGPDIFYRTANLSHCSCAFSVCDFSGDSDNETSRLFYGIGAGRCSGKLRSSLTARPINGFSCGHAPSLSDRRNFAGGKICHPIGQQHGEVWPASGVRRRNDRGPGAYTRGNRRYSSHFAQSVTAFDKYSARVRTCDHRTHNSRRADHQLDYKTTGNAWRAGWQPSAALINVGSERGYVYEQKDKYPARLRALAPLRCFCAADICTLKCSSQCG